MLKRQYTQNLYLNSLSTDLQTNLRQDRHSRLIILIRTWKCWKAYLAKKKLKFQLNKTANLFKVENETRTRQECFSALRFHKENKKEQIMESALDNEVDI